MKSEILLKDLGEYVVNKSALAQGAEYDKWLLLPYETGEFSGVALAAMDNFHPVAIKLSIGASGWYKIYLGVLTFGGRAGIGVRFGKDDQTLIEPKLRVSHCWQPNEWIEEGFFRAMDLTGKNLTLTKSECEGIMTTGGLAYIRLVPMTEEEVAAYQTKEGGCVAFHYDIDFSRDFDKPEEESYAGRLRMLENTCGGEWFLETAFDHCYVDEPEGHVYLSTVNKTHARRYAAYIKDATENHKSLIKEAKKLGYKTYATQRMEMADFCFPYSLYSWRSGIADPYPEYHCKMRDGRSVEVLSYAYPKTRRLSIELLMKPLEDGFDGLTLIFHRGLHVAFEQPVIDRVQQLYGVDARKLPFADERLHGVLCEVMTTFMRELKAEVTRVYGDTKKINAIVYYDATQSKQFGLDVETWCKEGLVDGICQGLMTHYEKLDGCLGEDGLIDLEKYKEENGKRMVLCRTYDGDPKLVINGAKELKPICDRYGKTFYASLLWEGNSPFTAWDMAQELREMGVTQFMSWNANHKAKDMAYINTERSIARKETENKHESRFLRVLSMAGKDISSFCQNWRG
ncbi:MAG: hypothetical protein IJX87_01665 [Clostridia bacterium]|nr:hypothetical protein [Clostridia bacterium]